MFTGTPSDNKLSWRGVFVHLIIPHLPKGCKRTNTKLIINHLLEKLLLSELLGKKTVSSLTFMFKSEMLSYIESLSSPDMH